MCNFLCYLVYSRNSLMIRSLSEYMSTYTFFTFYFYIVGKQVFFEKKIQK